MSSKHSFHYLAAGLVAIGLLAAAKAEDYLANVAPATDSESVGQIAESPGQQDGEASRKKPVRKDGKNRDQSEYVKVEVRGDAENWCGSDWWGNHRDLSQCEGDQLGTRVRGRRGV